MSTSHYDYIDDPNRPQFSVYTFFDNDSYEPVMRWVSLERAKEEVTRLIEGPAARVTKRIIVTDGGDHCIFEWTRAKGVTWPIPQTDWEIRKQ